MRQAPLQVAAVVMAFAPPKRALVNAHLPFGYPQSPMLDLSQLLAPHIALTAEDVRLLQGYLAEARYAAGAVIFPPGKVCQEVLVLHSGLVRAYYLHQAREVNLRFLCAPSVAVALSSLIQGKDAEESVEAVTETFGTRARIADFERDHPGALAERMRRVLAEQHYLSMERRLRMLQWKSAAERYDYFLKHMEPDIVAGMPGYHVASYLGVAPESLSRVRAARAARRS